MRAESSRKREQSESGGPKPVSHEWPVGVRLGHSSICDIGPLRFRQQTFQIVSRSA
jgi:hypothetical protein